MIGSHARTALEDASTPMSEVQEEKVVHWGITFAIAASAFVGSLGVMVAAWILLRRGSGQEIAKGVRGVQLTPLDVFLHTSIQSIWSILSAFLLSSTPRALKMLFTPGAGAPARKSARDATARSCPRRTWSPCLGHTQGCGSSTPHRGQRIAIKRAPESAGIEPTLFAC
jgi:hypothetical protein